MRQGDALSCLLFNLAQEKAVRSSGPTARGIICQKTLQNLAFANDIALIGRSRRFVAEACELGQKIHAGKTKFMETLPDYQPFKIKNYTFETISQFKRLGTTIITNNDRTVAYLPIF